MMSQWDELRTVALSEINPRFSCPLCQGYIIDCVTAEECGHAYCRSCIARHIANGTVTCPKCNKMFNAEEPGEPFHKLRTDSVLQRLIYKMIPNLVSKETERRAVYSGSEQLARKEVKLSVGKDAIFFNERSCVCIEMKRRMDNLSPAATGIQQTQPESSFLRMELATPLCVLIDFVKLRTGTNSNISLSSSHKAPFLDPEMRLIDLAYLISWDMTRPLPVYYELINTNHHPASRSQPLTPMLRTESTPAAAASQSQSQHYSSSSSSSSPASSPTSNPVAKLKIKFNKNQVGNWQTQAIPSGTYMDEAELERRYHGGKPYSTPGRSAGKRRYVRRDPPKVAKVLPFPAFPVPTQLSPSGKDYDGVVAVHRSDPESEILKSTGLVPFANSSSSSSNAACSGHTIANLLSIFQRPH